MFPNPVNFERFAIGFALVFVRVAGLMLMAPLFGSARIPRRFKLLIALVMAIPMFHFDANVILPAALRSEARKAAEAAAKAAEAAAAEAEAAEQARLAEQAAAEEAALAAAEAEIKADKADDGKGDDAAPTEGSDKE